MSGGEASLRRALGAIGAAGILAGIATGAIILTSDIAEDPALTALLTLLVSWSFLATGIYIWDQRPDNLIGPLMVAAAFGWCLVQLGNSTQPWLFAIGVACNSVPFAFVLHMLIVFPSGKVQSGFDRFMVSYSYAAGCIVAVIPVVFLDSGHAGADRCGGCPDNPLLIWDNYDLANGIYIGLSGVSIFVLAVLAVAIYRRARSASAEQRRRDTPVYWSGVATVFLLGASLATNLGPEKGSYDDFLYYVAQLGILSVPYAFWLGLVRYRLGEAAEVAEENIRLDAKLQESLEELRESRARIVEAGYVARRRLERDLHDGAQQRLVALALDLRLARSKLPEDPGEAAAMLEAASEDLSRATQELRELARGIHPTLLSDRGLRDAVGALASRAPLPVAVDSDIEARLPEPVEAAAYFVVAEALTNVSRHAAADSANVAMRRDNGVLLVEVRDNGRGGADVRGSGLRGLADRVAALDGDFQVRSGPGGTLVRAKLPVG